MIFSFFKYFFSYIVSARNRQKLIILAIVGLFLSSFALLVLQSTMGGLQYKLMERSKLILGKATIFLNKDISELDLSQIESILNSHKISFSREYEIELLIKYQTFMTPVIVHGIDLNSYLPPFLGEAKKIDSLMPIELAYKIGITPLEEVQLISPSHVDSFLGDIPRSQSIKVSNVFSSDVPEVDSNHLWVRLPAIQNLIQAKKINRIRLFSHFDFELLKPSLPSSAVLKTWESENKTLVWALNLESSVMIFLFAIMSLLVSICISSGLLIFFNKVKTDLASFWILGASYSKINKTTKYFLHFTSFLSITMGVLSALIFLYFFDRFAPEVMPDVFVDRKIPILVTGKGLFISFFVPYAISYFFVFFSLKQFEKEHNPLDQVRSVS